MKTNHPMNTNNSRRSFLKTASMGSMLSFGLPGIVTSVMEAEKVKKIFEHFKRAIQC